MSEYPKWVYPVGIRESYNPGEEPYLIHEPEVVEPEVVEKVKKSKKAVE